MARKVIFKGIVNGTEYDNVQDYNKAVAKVMESNDILNCESRTQTVDEPDEDILMTPFFEEFGQKYLEELADCNGSQELDARIDEAFDKVFDHIEEVEDLDAYRETLARIVDQVTNDKKEITETVKKLETQIAALKKGNEIAAAVMDTYRDLIDAVDNEREKNDAPEEEEPVNIPDIGGGIMKLLNSILGENKK